MALTDLTPDARRELRNIARSRAKQAFSKKAGINSRTLTRLIEKGNAESHIVVRVNEALGLDNAFKNLTIETIERIVCTQYGTTPEAVRKVKRELAIQEAKQVIIYLSVEIAGIKRTAVARHFSYADHTGLIAPLKTITGRLDVEGDLREVVRIIKTKLQAAA